MYPVWMSVYQLGCTERQLHFLWFNFVSVTELSSYLRSLEGQLRPSGDWRILAFQELYTAPGSNVVTPGGGGCMRGCIIHLLSIFHRVGRSSLFSESTGLLSPPIPFPLGFSLQKKKCWGTSLVAQGLRFQAPKAGSTGSNSIPPAETKGPKHHN